MISCEMQAKHMTEYWIQYNGSRNSAVQLQMVLSRNPRKKHSGVSITPLTVYPIDIFMQDEADLSQKKTWPTAKMLQCRETSLYKPNLRNKSEYHSGVHRFSIFRRLQPTIAHAEWRS